MAVLDDQSRYEKMDPGGIGLSLADFPRQYSEALKIAADLPAALSGGYNRVFFCGMGGSALGADLLCNFAAAQEGTIPFHVVRNYRLPSYAGKDSLVFLISYSGETEETLICYRQAKERGATVVVIASGGALLAAAEAAHDPCFRVPGGLQPRMATFYLSVPALLTLARLDIVVWNDEEIVSACRDLLEIEGKIGVGIPQAENAAKRMALALQNKIVVIWGSENLTDMVAKSWKNQINENAKAAAWFNSLPEADHNEIMGAAAPQDVLRSRLALVLLRDPAEHPRVQKRFTISSLLLAERYDIVLEHWARGHSLPGRLWGQMLFGNYVSYYLALLYGIDPQPVRDIQHLKRALGSGGE